MALAAGAAPAGELGAYRAETMAPRSLQAKAVVFIYLAVEPVGVRLESPRHVGRRATAVLKAEEKSRTLLI